MADQLSPVQELTALREQTAGHAAEFARITGELNAANGLLAEAQTQITTLTTERDTARAEGVRVTGELATANASVLSLTGERDTATASLAKASKRLESPSAEAAAICAAMGVDALSIRPGAKIGGATGNGEELLTQMAALPANEQLGFYNKNQAAIDAYRRQHQS